MGRGCVSRHWGAPDVYHAIRLTARPDGRRSGRAGVSVSFYALSCIAAFFCKAYIKVAIENLWGEQQSCTLVQIYLDGLLLHLWLLDRVGCGRQWSHFLGNCENGLTERPHPLQVF